MLPVAADEPSSQYTCQRTMEAKIHRDRASFPMHKILADTCVWENLAKDPQQRPLLNVIFELESSGELGLIVPRVVLDEWGRRKERITKENTRSVSGLLKRIKEIVGKHGDGDGKAAALVQLNLVDSKLP